MLQHPPVRNRKFLTQVLSIERARCCDYRPPPGQPHVAPQRVCPGRHATVCSWRFPGLRKNTAIRKLPPKIRNQTGAAAHDEPLSWFSKMRPNLIKITVTAAASLFGLTTDLRAQEVATVPEVEITGTAPGVLPQDQQVAQYGQPRWPTDPAFANTRVKCRREARLGSNSSWTQELPEATLHNSFRGESKLA